MLDTNLEVSTFDTECISFVSAQLERLGFNAKQVKNATGFLRYTETSKSLNTKPSEALNGALEYLLLHTPECDLPRRFLPANNNSNSFIVSLHDGNQDIQLRWLEEKANKEAGWPPSAVKTIISSSKQIISWELLLEALNRQLIGAPYEHLLDEEVVLRCDDFSRVIQEIDAVRSVYVDSTYSEVQRELVVPLCSGQMQVHILVLPEHPYPRSSRRPPIYITSSGIPAYIRLYCIKQTLEFLDQMFPAETDEDLIFTIIEKIEETWEVIQLEGPPDILDVMVNLKSIKDTYEPIHSVAETLRTSDIIAQPNKGARKPITDDRSDLRIKEELNVMMTSKEYASIIRARERLPAFHVRDKFLKLLQKERVIVVVGETGMAHHLLPNCSN